MEIRSQHLAVRPLRSLRDRSMPWNLSERHDFAVSPLWDEHKHLTVAWESGYVVSPDTQEILYYPVLAELDADELDQP